MTGTRVLETAAAKAATIGWAACQAVNRWFPSKAFQPKWASRPMLKSWERTSPVLGWPRTTDSLCPTCVREARARILSGAADVDILRTSQVGEIKAQILERDGRIIVEKTCPT